MQELFPILSGLVVGLALGSLAPRVRLPVGIGAAIVLGTVATIISGEFQIGWEFLLIDIPLVGFSATVGLVVSRVLRRRVTDGNQS